MGTSSKLSDIQRQSQALSALPAFRDLERQVETQAESTVQGVSRSSSAFLLARLAASTGRVLLWVLPHIEDADAAVEDANFFDAGCAQLFPAHETLPTDDLPPSMDIVSQRLLLLRDLCYEAQRGEAETRGRLIVTPIQAILQKVTSRRQIQASTLTLQTGQSHPMQEVVQWLAARRFERASQVEYQGEFSVRGGIVDIFPFSSEAPYRIEFFGDEIDSIREFDLELQTSQRKLNSCQIVALPGRGATEGAAGDTSLIHFLPDTAAVVFEEPIDLEERAQRYADSVEKSDAIHRFEDLLSPARKRKIVWLSRLPTAGSKAAVTFDVQCSMEFGADVGAALRELRRTVDATRRTIVVCSNSAEKKRLEQILKERDFGRSPSLRSCVGRVNHSFVFHDTGLAVVATHEMFHRYRERREPRRQAPARAVDSFLDLSVGDLVVHATHGIARYLGLNVLEHEGRSREYMTLEFAGGARVYVPASRVELVQKYVGGSDRRPNLSRLGSRSWEARKAKAHAACEDVASDLLELQAAREVQAGIACPPDDDWQHEFESEFIYEETEDQLVAADEIRRDMTTPRPMDRLICGDVGYGKTELAMRAAFRTVNGGRQVAVLVPTTVLAEQHFRTFRERMADYPVETEVLSRFRTRKEQREILERAKAGQVDVLIGTHRLVQKDVEFSDLGLVIIDEEQRFGVEHKERLKRLRAMVDVLTLTATPIPRTLHMALLGIRDISSLNTPPHDRLAIQTRIWRFDEGRIRQAILRELGREGQVFFLHNRVHNIEGMARRVQRIVPEAEIGIAHGQMPERLLAKQMMDFVKGRIDVLVCTTIIESGLDIPNANTIIINNADMFGLADLHQLRGRVGRYRHRAYAYLLLPTSRTITPDAEKRLKAIEEYSDLGAGFRIAMRDLEIRGAGNILGAEQSGHIVAVGYEMYCRLLERSIKRAKHEPIDERPDVSINLNLAAYLPDSYVSDPRLKIELYRKIHRAEDEQQLTAILEEMRDRFDEPPREAKELVAEAQIRILARAAGLVSLAAGEGGLMGRVDTSRVRPPRLAAESGGVIRAVDKDTIHVVLPASPMSAGAIVEFLSKALRVG